MTEETQQTQEQTTFESKPVEEKKQKGRVIFSVEPPKDEQKEQEK